MTLGGLALAGANRGIMGETGPDGEDGILYALEAQNLNLEGTELVVLSACDTGKGEVDVSEGVYGVDPGSAHRWGAEYPDDALAFER